jgi:subtilisin family serine protease
MCYAQVDYIEPDTNVSTQRITQTDAPWGLGRISHREPGSTNYIYDKSAGEGTFSYIIDTGIFIDHLDFNGRATWGANFADDGLDGDGNGHGTHCAGITGGTTYGVAKKTQLIAVKVLDSEGNGANSGVIAGIQWAVNDAISKGRQ